MSATEWIRYEGYRIDCDGVSGASPGRRTDAVRWTAAVPWIMMPGPAKSKGKTPNHNRCNGFARSDNDPDQRLRASPVPHRPRNGATRARARTMTYRPP
ncbi:hypothetical protein McPS_13060 [Marichromatium sp. PS1]